MYDMYIYRCVEQSVYCPSVQCVLCRHVGDVHAVCVVSVCVVWYIRYKSYTHGWTSAVAKARTKRKFIWLHFLLMYSKLNKRHGRTIHHAPCSVIQVTPGLGGAYLSVETPGGGEGMLQQEPWVSGSNAASSCGCGSPTVGWRVLQGSSLTSRYLLWACLTLLQIGIGLLLLNLAGFSPP